MPNKYFQFTIKTKRKKTATSLGNKPEKEGSTMSQRKIEHKGSMICDFKRFWKNPKQGGTSAFFQPDHMSVFVKQPVRNKGSPNCPLGTQQGTAAG